MFAYNDEYAMLLMRALQDEGIGVPEETAVIGADDLMLGRLLRPRLSTVHIELPSGRHLAELVDRVVRDPASVPRPTTYWARGSCTANRASRTRAYAERRRRAGFDGERHHLASTRPSPRRASWRGVHSGQYAHGKAQLLDRCSELCLDRDHRRPVDRVPSTH